jgi:adenine specific DNA methylase Mod
MIYKGDNLEVMKHLISIGTKADLIYADPPFGIPTDKKFGLPAWKKTDYYDEFVFKKFEWLDENDKKFLSFLRPRLILMRELLSETGSIYVHLDWHVGHYVKILLDEILGKHNFINEIIWCYSGPTPVKTAFARKHDAIYFFSKSEKYYFVGDYIEHKSGVHNTGQVFGSTNNDIEKIQAIEERGKLVEDWWVDIFTSDRIRSEQVGYSTQKPSKLLTRIIKSSCPENGLVLDFFGGSGTAAAVAEKLNRRWITCDQNEVSLETMCKRLEYDLNKVIEI